MGGSNAVGALGYVECAFELCTQADEFGISLGGVFTATSSGGTQAGRVARCEGILLDPVYSGKAMAGLIALIRRGDFAGSDAAVFLHTGGTPALFAYRDALTRG